MNPSPAFTALLREGVLAVRLLGSGATALRKGVAGEAGIFIEALFALSIGIERIAKLVVILDRRLTTGAFPTYAEMKRIGHDIATLFRLVDGVATNRRVGTSFKRPADPIHQQILSVLSNFAKATRYQNLDSLVGGATQNSPNPESEWFTRVGTLVLTKHYPNKKRTKDEDLANRTHALLGGNATVLNLGHSVWERDLIGTIRAVQESTVVQRHAQFYMLQIIRHRASVLVDLQSIAHRDNVEVPFYCELFSHFLCDDKALRGRKTWNL